MSSFTVQSRTATNRVALGFVSEGDQLMVASMGEGTPAVVVQSFDPGRDAFYFAPTEPTVPELEEELHIHFPKSLRQKLDGRTLASTMGRFILLQVAERQTPVLSPLASVRRVLEVFGPVNSAILQADNGGLLFVRRAGNEFTAHASTHTITTFLTLSYEERESLFPDFSAQEVILSGSDFSPLEVDLSDPLLLMRKISVQDFVSLVDVSEDVFATVNDAPHQYTLAIGAAAIYAEIRRTTKASI